MLYIENKKVNYTVIIKEKLYSYIFKYINYKENHQANSYNCFY